MPFLHLCASTKITLLTSGEQSYRVHQATAFDKHPKMGYAGDGKDARNVG